MKLLLKPKFAIIFWLNMYDILWCIFIYQLICDLFYYNTKVLIEPIYYVYLYKKNIILLSQFGPVYPGRQPRQVPSTISQ